MSQALEVQPHGSGFLLENGANTHTPEETEGSVCGKRTIGELSSPGGREQGLQFELHVWKLNIAQSINYFTDSAPLLL